MDTYLISWVKNDGTLGREISFCTREQAKEQAKDLFIEKHLRLVSVRETESIFTIQEIDGLIYENGELKFDK